MNDNREIFIHARESLHGPHGDLPAAFVPLRLRHDEEHVTFEVTCPVVLVGRSSRADLRLAFPDVSRQHCRLAFENGQWRVCDLKSLNGVFVNEIRAAEATLYAGDTLRLGCISLRVLAATPVRLTKAEALQNDKLRQIVEVLPSKG